VRHLTQAGENPRIDGIPSPATAQLPAVDNVAHQIELAGLNGFQKSQESGRLRMPATQMHIAHKDRPYWSSCQSLAVGAHVIAPWYESSIAPSVAAESICRRGLISAMTIGFR
jgi:hypothetical protein